MGSVKSVLAGICIAVSTVALSAGDVRAMTIISNSAIGTIRDNPKNDVPDFVFDFVFSALNQSIQEDRGIVEFDIRGFNASIGQAILQIAQVGTLDPPNAIPVDVYGYTGNGVLDLDGSDFLLGTLPPLGFTVPLGAGFTVDLDVTDIINDQIAANSAFVGFNLRLPNIETEALTFVFDGPTLTITDAQVVLPEPGTIAVLGLGLLGLGLVRRRRC